MNYINYSKLDDCIEDLESGLTSESAYYGDATIELAKKIIKERNNIYQLSIIRRGIK